MSTVEDLLFHTVDGVFAVDSRQRIIFWNSGCAQLLDIPTNEALHRHCNDIVRGKDLIGEPFCSDGCCVARMTDGGKGPTTFPLQVSNGNGSELHLSVSIVLMPSREKDCWACVHLLHREGVTNALDVMEYADQAKSVSYSGRGNGNSSNDVSTLTARESEILKLLAEGLTARVISKMLYISLVTVRNHIQHIQAKLGVHSQAETVAYAYRHNLL
ncbi:MAG: LuxR C-terminal-related transcriptional regulator [Gammaproteobacteria bacterium]